MSAPEHEETRVTLAGDLTTMADRDVDVLFLSTRLFPVFAARKCSERTTIPERRRHHCKSDEGIDTGIKKWFPGMLSKALQMLEKVYHYSKNYFEVNVTYIGFRLLISVY
jgi:hypothetical protein